VRRGGCGAGCKKPAAAPDSSERLENPEENGGIELGITNGKTFLH